MNAEALTTFDQEVGAFARIFPRRSAHELASAFAATDLKQVQLNLNAIGYPTIPTADDLSLVDFDMIRDAFEGENLVLWGISATYNMAAPDERMRTLTTHAAAQYITALAPVRPFAVTLCTGTRDGDDMWRAHPDNQDDDAWTALLRSLEVLIPAARRAGVVLGVEPEPCNVVAGISQAERLLVELGPDADIIGLILDPANLVANVPRNRHAGTLEDAFMRLSDRVVCVHAKDTVPWSATLAGDGVLNYDHILSLWNGLPNRVPLIIQDATENQIPQLRRRLREAYIALTW